MKYLSFDNLMDSSDSDEECELLGEVTFIPSFKGENDSEFSPVVVIDSSNLSRLYF